MNDADRDRGATLLELTAVLAIFSIVAILSLQMLSSALENRHQITAANTAAEAIAAFSTVFRRDVKMSTPVAGRSGAAMRVSENGYSLAFVTVASQPDLANTATRLADVTWRYDAAAKTVSRSSRPYGEDVQAQEWTILEGALNWRVWFISDVGQRVAAEQWSGEQAWDLPLGLDVQLETSTLGDIEVLVSR